MITGLAKYDIFFIIASQKGIYVDIDITKFTHKLRDRDKGLGL